MRHVVEKASRPLEAEFSRITGGLKMGQIAKVKEWCEGQGFDLPDMKKETLDKLLGTTAEGAEIEFEDGEEWMLPPVMSPEVRRVLHIRQLIGSASIKKLGKMEQTVCYDGRAHGLLQYHGAGPGRWAGRLLQPQNFPRGSVSKKIAIDDVVAALMSEDLARIEEVAGVPPVETVVSSLRYAITAAPGKELCVADFAQIEARVLLALAGQWDKVDLFATGADIYCDMASQIYRRTITKENPVERQTGKNSVLGLGFGMGPPKFHFRYAQDQPLEFCQEVVRTYRKEWAPKVPPVWYALEAAAAKCVHTGLPQEAYGVVYEKIDLWLTALLPSGRRLWYFNPQPVWTSPPWDASDLRMGFTYQAKKQNRWLTISAYGALLCENVVQALARDLMVESAYRAEANGFPIVLTVHDELVTEPDTWCSDYKALEQMMSERSPWATAMKIPVAAEGWQGDRYRK
jgi:DNA polymerase